MTEAQELCFWCDAFIEQRLPTSQRVLFELHLADCQECQRKISRWQELEQDVAAAFKLFGSASPVDPFCSLVERNAEALIPLADFPTQLRSGSKGRFLRPLLSRSWARYRAWTAAAILLTAAIIGWRVADSTRPGKEQTASRTGQQQPQPGAARTDSPPSNPPVVVRVQEPVVALPAVTNSRFTVIRLYPVFETNIPDKGN